MSEIPFPSLLDDVELDIPIPVIVNPDEVLVSTKDEHVVRIKRKAESIDNSAKKRKLESDLETLNAKQLAKEAELNVMQSKINDLELTIRRVQTSLREAQNEKLSLIMALNTINTKVKVTKSKLLFEKKSSTTV